MTAIVHSSQEQALAEMPPRLCASVEGVEFWIALSTGRRVRCVITEAALRVQYDAQEDRPDSWMASFERHRVAIERRALLATGRREDVRVVVLHETAGRFLASAGRCMS